jgi:hypothetical protein
VQLRTASVVFVLLSPLTHEKVQFVRLRGVRSEGPIAAAPLIERGEDGSVLSARILIWLPGCTANRNAGSSRSSVEWANASGGDPRSTGAAFSSARYSATIKTVPGTFLSSAIESPRCSSDRRCIAFIPGRAARRVMILKRLILRKVVGPDQLLVRLSRWTNAKVQTSGVASASRCACHPCFSLRNPLGRREGFSARAPTPLIGLSNHQACGKS